MRIIEESGEIIQAVMKGERFGWDNFHPQTRCNNLDQLSLEIQDLLRAFEDLKESLLNHDKQQDSDTFQTDFECPQCSTFIDVTSVEIYGITKCYKCGSKLEPEDSSG